VNGDKQRAAGQMPAIGGGEAAFQVADGGGHDSRLRPRSHSPRRMLVIFL
jgi:hypothetical protein